MVFIFFSSLIKLYGYLGVFLVSLLGSSTVILPLPSVTVIFAAGALLNPLFVGLIGGLGSSIGELTAYAIGFGGEKILEKKLKKYIANAEKLFEKHGGFIIIILFAVTGIFYDVIGILSGTLKYPVKKFFIATLIGKLLLYLILAYAGFYSVNWILEVFSSFS